jgi:Kef-type K+ transport system membrane component KefB
MVGRAVALVLLVGSVLAMRMSAPGDTVAELRGTALAFGFALIAAVLAGDLVERARLPRLSGYLLFGLLCGPFAADLISRAMALDLQQINGVAIALIALVAGLEMNLHQLRSSFGALARLTAVTLGASVAFFAVAFTIAWPWLPLPDLPNMPMQVAVATVVALLAVSFSPTVTIAVVAESRARGPLTRLVMAVVVVADLVLIVGFALALQAVRRASGASAAEEVGLLAVLSWELLGSIAFGGIVGSAFALYLRFVAREITIVLIGVCILLASLGRVLHFEIVLAAVTAGLVVENIAPPRGDALKLAVERGALPVLVVFFVAAGASLQLDALAAVGAVTLVIAATRAAVLYFAARAGRWWADLPEPSSLAWMGLVSQGGVTLGLASIVANEFPDWGGAVYTLIIALTAVHVLIGPVLFRAALARAGEIGRMDEGD